MTNAFRNKILTVDADVINCYFQHKGGYLLLNRPRVQRISDFCCILEKYPLAINSYIKSEYQEMNNPEVVKNWLAIRLQDNLAFEVNCRSLPSCVKNRLRDDYSFNIYSRDKRYLETCYRTSFKHFITENTRDFFKRHHRPRRLRMDKYLKRKLGISIYQIDPCCEVLMST